VADPADRSRVFTWLLQRRYDDKGNLIVFEYKAEDHDNIPSSAHEANRTVARQSAPATS
jgi:Salmonella virulence plasmid 65kDa B protein